MRRLHVPEVATGEIEVPQREAHHARNVLRLVAGDAVELFDDAGRLGRGVIAVCDANRLLVRVDELTDAPANSFQWVVASAVPKGSRVDWMIEKLSELGTGAFVPLATARSIVLPEGKGKRDRWSRIAAEAAKQSRRAGVMRIHDLTPLDAYLKTIACPTWLLSTAADAVPALAAAQQLRGLADGGPSTWHLLIGPEGGWTEAETAAILAAGAMPVSLGLTVLRIETAAVAAAAVAAAIATGITR